MSKINFSLGLIDEALVKRFRNLKKIKEIAGNRNVTHEAFLREILDTYEPVITEQTRYNGGKKNLIDLKDTIETIVENTPGEYEGDDEGDGDGSLL